MKDCPGCDICGKKANVFITLMKEGKEISLNLCQEHAESTGLFNGKTYGLLGDKEPASTPLKGVISCPNCHATPQDFNKSGRFGCPHCYESFDKDVKLILKHIQPGLVHKGKAPNQSLNAESVKKRLKSLQTQLDEAIKLEHYEDAAHFRDEINQLSLLIPKVD